MASHGVTCVTFSLYPILFFFAYLSYSLQSSKRFFFVCFFVISRSVNIILIFCIVGQILAVNEGPHVKYNMSKSPFSLNETKEVLK